MLEKATFVGEYDSIRKTGLSSEIQMHFKYKFTTLHLFIYLFVFQVVVKTALIILKGVM